MAISVIQQQRERYAGVLESGVAISCESLEVGH